LHRALEVEIVKRGRLLNREGKRQRIRAKATTKATADFSTTAAKYAAFGRNDGVWVGARKNTQRQQQQQISPLRRQSAPPSVEMTIFGWRDFAQWWRDFAQRGRDPQL